MAISDDILIKKFEVLELIETEIKFLFIEWCNKNIDKLYTIESKVISVDKVWGVDVDNKNNLAYLVYRCTVDLDSGITHTTSFNSEFWKFPQFEHELKEEFKSIKNIREIKTKIQNEINEKYMYRQVYGEFFDGRILKIEYCDETPKMSIMIKNTTSTIDINTKDYQLYNE